MKNTPTGLANAVCEIIIAESINHIKWPIKVFNQKLILRYLVNELYIMMLNQNLTPCMGGESATGPQEHCCSEQKITVEHYN